MPRSSKGKSARRKLAEILEWDAEREAERTAVQTSSYWSKLHESERSRLEEVFAKERADADALVLQIVKTYRPAILRGEFDAGGVDTSVRARYSTHTADDEFDEDDDEDDDDEQRLARTVSHGTKRSRRQRDRRKRQRDQLASTYGAPLSRTHRDRWATRTVVQGRKTKKRGKGGGKRRGQGRGRKKRRRREVDENQHRVGRGRGARPGVSRVLSMERQVHTPTLKHLLDHSQSAPSGLFPGGTGGQQIEGAMSLPPITPLRQAASPAKAPSSLSSPSLPEMSSATAPVDSRHKDILRKVKMKLKKELKRVMDIFRDLDESGDGLISKRELYRGLKMLGFKIDLEIFGLLYAEIDINGDGAIEFKELSKAIRKIDTKSRPANSTSFHAYRKGGKQGKKIERLNADILENKPIALQIDHGKGKLKTFMAQAEVRTEKKRRRKRKKRMDHEEKQQQEEGHLPHSKAKAVARPLDPLVQKWEQLKSTETALLDELERLKEQSAAMRAAVFVGESTEKHEEDTAEEEHGATKIEDEAPKYTFTRPKKNELLPPSLGPEVDVTFESGPLGMALGGARGQGDGKHKIIVLRFESPLGLKSKAEESGLVRVGDVIKKLNGQSVGGKTLNEVIAMIKSLPRPLTITFQHCVATPAEVARCLGNLFDVLDTDKSGYLDKDEWLNAVDLARKSQTSNSTLSAEDEERAASVLRAIEAVPALSPLLDPLTWQHHFDRMQGGENAPLDRSRFVRFFKTIVQVTVLGKEPEKRRVER